MTYNVEDIEDVLEEYGEVTVILDSGVEYGIHPKKFTLDSDSGVISGEGWHEEKEEYLHVEFPVDTIEHWYVHDTL